jgi:arylsulfatase A-like enzyme
MCPFLRIACLSSEIIPYAWLPNKNRQTLGAMATDLDTQLGRVVDAFKARGWWNNTLLWLVADNGKSCLMYEARLDRTCK